MLSSEFSMKWLCAVIFPEKYHGEHPTLGMETKYPTTNWQELASTGLRPPHVASTFRAQFNPLQAPSAPSLDLSGES